LLHPSAHTSLDVYTILLVFRFFFILRPLPRDSTLFPYTTLFRSVIVRRQPAAAPVPFAAREQALAAHPGRPLDNTTMRAANGTRSEEHTSELQSLRHLVCRLLLEKKKKRETETIIESGHYRCHAS